MSNRNPPCRKRHNPRRSCVPGFTLVEILVAIFIFSILLLPLTALLIAESKFAAKHEQKIIAMLVAKNEIETGKKAVLAVESGEYTVTMRGKTWNVVRTVETGEGAAIDTSLVLKKTFVTVRVSKENDSVKLAEFRVMREIWR
jgi:type II secretion system protein I